MSEHAITNDLLKAAHKASFKNRAACEASDLCGCFYCRETYAPSAIKEYVKENGSGETAVCPKCGVDSVLPSIAGYPLTDDFLRRMEAMWFEQ